jgi:hypothetical protein
MYRPYRIKGWGGRKRAVGSLVPVVLGLDPWRTGTLRGVSAGPFNSQSDGPGRVMTLVRRTPAAPPDPAAG